MRKTIRKYRPVILSRLKDVVAQKDFNYRTFGTAIEDHLFDIIISILKEKRLITDNSQFKRAKDKNEFPDLTIKTMPKIALEAKSGNRSKLIGGKWKPCKNSANDLGTFNSWGKKLAEFGGDNIFFIFIEYNFNDRKKEIINVKIGPFYRFVGLNKAGLLSYREKDGNLRPKDFDEEPPIKTLNKFFSLLKKTDIYRSKRIIRKHQARIKSLS